MEGYPLAQLEGVAQAIVGNGPARRQSGLYGPVRAEPGQPLEHVGVEHLIDGACGSRSRVKVRGLELKTDDRVGTLGLRCDGGRNGEKGDDCSGDKALHV